MKPIAAAACVIAITAGIASADPVYGTWKTQTDAGAYAHVTMAACGAKICGTIARTFKSGGEYQSENLGKTLVIDMVPNGTNSYAGSVWQPSKDKIYIGKMTLNGAKLKLKGCIAGGLICKAQTWMRID